MTTSIYVNLPVKDLAKTRTFFEGLGFSFNERFCDDTALCMQISENIFAMLLTHAKFSGFSNRKIAPARESSEVMTCISLPNREEVDRLVEAAIAGGGSEIRPMEDLGFMYHRAFDDLDGHIWEAMWLKPATAG